MASWIIGVDEAGYGPNLGPLVMTAVACRVPDELAGADLWHVLGGAVRKGNGPDDGRLVVDDSKVVYDGARGLAALERGVLGALWRGAAAPPPCLGDLVTWAWPDTLDDLRGETWYRGGGPVPSAVEAGELAQAAADFDRCCSAGG